MHRIRSWLVLMALVLLLTPGCDDDDNGVTTRTSDFSEFSSFTFIRESALGFSPPLDRVFLASIERQPEGIYTLRLLESLRSD